MKWGQEGGRRDSGGGSKLSEGCGGGMEGDGDRVGGGGWSRGAV